MMASARVGFLHHGDDWGQAFLVADYNVHVKEVPDTPHVMVRCRLLPQGHNLVAGFPVTGGSRELWYRDNARRGRTRIGRVPTPSDYPNTPATIEGIIFACVNIEMPVCIRIWDLVKPIISCAISASRIIDSDAVAVSWLTCRF
jgi:hypothetical protein